MRRHTEGFSFTPPPMRKGFSYGPGMMRNCYNAAAGFILAVIVSATVASAEAQPLSLPSITIHIVNVPDGIGTLRVALCRRDEFLSRYCDLHAMSPSYAGSTDVALRAVPPGIYAVQVYQDRNKNGYLDRSFIGIPEEPIGFSRDPKLHFGPPSFDQCALRITEQGGVVPVTLIIGR